MITLCLPVSNKKGFENLQKTLFNLSTDLDKRINILCLCSNKELYLPIRDYILQYNAPGEELTVYTEKKNVLVSLEYLGNKDEYIFLWNQNVIVPPEGVISLYREYLERPKAGFISGRVNKVVPYWVNDIYADKPKLVKTDKHKIESEVDVSYPFCMLTRMENFELYYPNRGNGLKFGLNLRRAGFQNYLNKQVICKYNVEEK